MSILAENLVGVRERIASAAARSGRSSGEVTLVAVTKGCSVQAIRSLWALGLRDLGENRVQEALPKIGLGLSDVRWHLIGHLQENKINRILPHVHMIQSVDSIRLARSIDMRAARNERRVPVLLEVKTAPEPTKHGVGVEEAEDVYAELGELRWLEPSGLMTMASQATSSDTRQCFRTLRQIFERLQSSSRAPRILSMGMSGDFEIAIEEGSTMIRVGRALMVGANGEEGGSQCA